MFDRKKTIMLQAYVVPPANVVQLLKLVCFQAQSKKKKSRKRVKRELRVQMTKSKLNGLNLKRTKKP